MIYGMPKTGKSYLMIEFAGYLARNHGSVLYVAKEEELDDTLQQKLEDTESEHDEFYVSDYLPSDLSSYNFVFLDSVTKMRLKPDDLVRLGKQYPNISFVYVFQATKHGAFRGSNEFQHDVDVVIEVPKKGIATQYGRFNQGGRMKIFKD
jgi:predicted ATP-dependent serine protease